MNSTAEERPPSWYFNPAPHAHGVVDSLEGGSHHLDSYFKSGSYFSQMQGYGQGKVYPLFIPLVGMHEFLCLAVPIAGRDHSQGQGFYPSWWGLHGATTTGGQNSSYPVHGVYNCPPTPPRSESKSSEEYMPNEGTSRGNYTPTHGAEALTNNNDYHMTSSSTQKRHHSAEGTMTPELVRSSSPYPYFNPAPPSGYSPVESEGGCKGIQSPLPGKICKSKSTNSGKNIKLFLGYQVAPSGGGNLPLLRFFFSFSSLVLLYSLGILNDVVFIWQFT